MEENKDTLFNSFRNPRAERDLWKKNKNQLETWQMLCLKQTNTRPAPATATQSPGEPGFSKYHKNVKRCHRSPEAWAHAAPAGPPPSASLHPPFFWSPPSMRKASRCLLTLPFWSLALRCPLRHPNRSVSALPWGLIQLGFFKGLGRKIR